MFKNFITLAYRHFVRSPLTSFIELFGMTAGLTVFLLVLLWVSHEISFDKFNEKADWIYRLEWSDVSERNAKCPSIIGPLLQVGVPEVEQFVRFLPSRNNSSILTRLDEQNNKLEFEAGRTIYADQNFFNIFSFEFITGNPKTALVEPNSIVITESLAKTMFGDKNAIGQQVSEPGHDDQRIITGVLKDVPNFHIPFKALISFSTRNSYANMLPMGNYTGKWGVLDAPTYLLINPDRDIKSLENKITQYVRSKRPAKHEKIRPNINYHLRPLKDVYFEGSEVKEMGYAKHGDSKKVLAYTTIAFFTLLLASINFINLNNAKSFERAKEVGIKKVSGASRTNVFVQFLGEVFMLCTISLILALIFTHSILPYFNVLMDTQVSMALLLDSIVFAAMIIGLLLISLTSGGFPALYMSSFQPVASVIGLPVTNGGKFNIKKLNLLLQFAITTILLITAITIYRQIGFMKKATLGFSREQLVSFDFPGNKNKVEVMKQVLSVHPHIQKVTYSTAVPGMNTISDQEFGEVKYEEVSYPQGWAMVDEDYAETLGLEMVAGRWYDKNILADRKPVNGTINMIFNESAINQIGLGDPIGKIVINPRGPERIIGVVKDFHLNSLDNPILPMHFVNHSWGNKMIARISLGDIPNTIKHINEEVEKMTGQAANVKFVDQEFDRQYQREDNFAGLVGNFTILAILIACMGLLGIATHAIKLRTKEIGIRKIVGASSLEVLRLLAQPFVKNIALSSILAVPIGWVLMDKWLSNYPYRIEQDWWVFALACGLTVVVAVFTIIWQSWRASSVNPARLIRYE